MSEMIYGKNTVIEMIRANHPIEEMWLTEQIFKKEAIIRNYLNNTKIKFHIMERKSIDKIISGNHQGVIAKIKAFTYYDIDDMLNDAKEKQELPLLVILDGLEDPHNLGAILRTSDCCGVHGVIIPKNRSVSLNATVAKLSAGAIKYVKVARVNNLNHTIKQLKDKGIWVVGCDMEGALDYREMDFSLPVAIVVGNEGKGISRLVKENCDVLVKIPMKGHISSLNVSVATAIILYEVMNKRCPL